MKETIHIDDEAAAYVLHALSDSDVAAVEAHAKHCPPCQQTLHDAHDTGQMLALVATPQQPPVWCKRNLMQRIERESFLTRSTRSTGSRAQLLTWTPVVAVMGLLLLWNVGLQSKLSTSRASLAAIQQQDTLLRTKMAQATAAHAMLANAQATLRLKSQNPSVPAAEGRMFMAPGQSAGVIIIKGLPTPPPGKVYQVWMTREGVQAPCGRFVRFDGTEPMMISAPQPLDSYKWIMITLEDSGASPVQPSTQKMLAGNL